jgi:hypothetical protein
VDFSKTITSILGFFCFIDIAALSPPNPAPMISTLIDIPPNV